jgi:hypothetical protein
VLGDTWAALLPDRKVYTAIAQWSEMADGNSESCSAIMNTMTFCGLGLLYAAIHRGAALSSTPSCQIVRHETACFRGIQHDCDACSRITQPNHLLAKMLISSRLYSDFTR